MVAHSAILRFAHALRWTPGRASPAPVRECCLAPYAVLHIPTQMALASTSGAGRHCVQIRSRAPLRRSYGARHREAGEPSRAVAVAAAPQSGAESHCAQIRSRGPLRRSTEHGIGRQENPRAPSRSPLRPNPEQSATAPESGAERHCVQVRSRGPLGRSTEHGIGRQENPRAPSRSPLRPNPEQSATAPEPGAEGHCVPVRSTA